MHEICGEFFIFQQVHNIDELKQHLIDVWHRFKQSIIDEAIDEWCKCLRVNLCERKTFWAFNLTPVMHICCLAYLVC